MAKKYNATPVIITFYPHPRQILHHEKNLHFLCSKREKAEILGRLGIKAIVTIQFTKEFAAFTPKQFIDNITSEPGISLRGICVGKHWKFGHGGSGGRLILEKLSNEDVFEFKAVDEVKLNGIRVSSSAIRKAIAAGDTILARTMLGNN